MRFFLDRKTGLLARMNVWPAGPIQYWGKDWGRMKVVERLTFIVNHCSGLQHMVLFKHVLPRCLGKQSFGRPDTFSLRYKS